VKGLFVSARCMLPSRRMTAPLVRPAVAKANTSSSQAVRPASGGCGGKAQGRQYFASLLPSFLDKASDALRCTVCSQVFDEPTRLEPCGHQFCKTCCAALVKCPTCQARSASRAPAGDIACRTDAHQVRCESCSWFGSMRDSRKHRHNSSNDDEMADVRRRTISFPPPDAAPCDSMRAPGNFMTLLCPPKRVAHDVSSYFGLRVRLMTIHGSWLRVHPGMGAVVDCQAKNAGPWEELILEPYKGEGVVIRTQHGTFLRAHPGNEGARVDTQVTQPVEWERWVFEPVVGHPGVFQIRSHHGSRLRAFPGDGGRIDLQPKPPREWERFRVCPADH
jgi:hypothetical protein